MKRILLIVGGGIAAYKACELIRLAKKAEIGPHLSAVHVKEVIDSLPNDQMLLAERALGIVRDALKPEIDADALLNKLASDPAIGQFLR